MERIHHPYWLWEEHKFGMWKTIIGKRRDILLKKAIKFTGDSKKYGFYMDRVVNEWKYSCEHNLSCKDINRQAWIGHAACCLAIGCPEDITRLAWHQLTLHQQELANAKADHAISKDGIAEEVPDNPTQVHALRMAYEMLKYLRTPDLTIDQSENKIQIIITNEQAKSRIQDALSFIGRNN